MDLDLSFNNRVRLNYQPPNNGQQSAVNPRTAPAPNSALAPGNNPGHMSHHHIYQSADTGTQQRQQPAINPWSNPPSTQCHWSYTAHFTPGCVAYPLVYPVPLVVRFQRDHPILPLTLSHRQPQQQCTTQANRMSNSTIRHQPRSLST